MNKIIVNENIIITDEACKFILDISNFNAKILINYMEKIKILDMPIDIILANKLCTNISYNLFEKYTQYLLNKEMQNAIKLLYDIYDKGYSVMDILDNYFTYVKITIKLNETQKYDIIPIICKYISIFHNIHEHEIELTLFTNNIYNILLK